MKDILTDFIVVVWTKRIFPYLTRFNDGRRLTFGEWLDLMLWIWDQVKEIKTVRPHVGVFYIFWSIDKRLGKFDS